MVGMTLSKGVPLEASEERWIAKVGLALQVQVEDFIDYPVGHGIELVALVLDLRLRGGCIAPQADVGSHLVVRRARPGNHVVAQWATPLCPFRRRHQPCRSVGTLPFLIPETVLE